MQWLAVVAVMAMLGVPAAAEDPVAGTSAQLDLRAFFLPQPTSRVIRPWPGSVRQEALLPGPRVICSTPSGPIVGAPPPEGADSCPWLDLFNDGSLTAAGPLRFALNEMMAGQPFGAEVFAALSTCSSAYSPACTAQVAARQATPRNSLLGSATPLVPLSDENPATMLFGAVQPETSPGAADALFSGLAPFTSPWQQALLGCGPLRETSCDDQGIDLRRANAAVVVQSFAARVGGDAEGWHTTDASVAQPGTVGFPEVPHGMPRWRWLRRWSLPGTGWALRRTPVPFAGVEAGPRYDRAVDGSVTGLQSSGGIATDAGPRLHPFTGQPFANEMAVLSWNLEMLLVGLAVNTDPVACPDATAFCPSQPFRDGACSFDQPQRCAGVAAIAAGAAPPGERR